MGLIEKVKDEVHHPSHYVNGGIEVIDILKAKMSREEFEGYLKGNIFKYLFRHRLKNGNVDLQKAQWYINYLVDFNAEKSSKK